MSHTGLLETERTQIAWYIAGSPRAPVLLLSNSLGTTSAMWEPQISRLSGHFRVLRYDQRGHGASGSPSGPYSIEGLGRDALDLLDALGVERAAVCGLSLGGMVAMWMAAHAPCRVTHLILASTSPQLGPPEAWRERAAIVRSSGMSVIAGSLAERWFTKGFRSSNRKAVTEVVSMLETCDSEGYASCCEAIATMDERSDLARITARTLVIAGAEDPVTPPAVAFDIARTIQTASLEVLQDASHLANIEQPARFTSAVLAHLTGDPTDRGMVVKREVFAGVHTEQPEPKAPTFSAPFRDLVNRYTWGEIWARPGLDRRTRGAVTIATLVATGRLKELSSQVLVAVDNGLSVEEILEVLLQSAVYCGMPIANEAFEIVGEALDSCAGDAAEGGVALRSKE